MRVSGWACTAFGPPQAVPLDEEMVIDTLPGYRAIGIAFALPRAALHVGFALVGSAAAGWLLPEGSPAGGRCG